MDQILCQETGKYTQLASLELGIENGETTGACDTGFACPYTNTISWKSASTPLPTQNDPRIIFERLFGDRSNTGAKARLARLEEQQACSIQSPRRRSGWAGNFRRPIATS